MNMATQERDTTNEITPEMINLVIARLKTLPSNASLSIGNTTGEGLKVDQLIKEVKKQSEIGKAVIESQLFFLRNLQNLPISS